MDFNRRLTNLHFVYGLYTVKSYSAVLGKNILIFERNIEVNKSFALEAIFAVFFQWPRWTIFKLLFIIQLCSNWHSIVYTKCGVQLKCELQSEFERNKTFSLMKEFERTKYPAVEWLASTVWLEQVQQSWLGIINAIKNCVQKVFVAAVTLLTPTREILGLNLGQNTGHYDRFWDFLQCLQDNFGMTFRLDYIYILPNNLHFNIYYHPMILALSDIDNFSFRK